MFQLHLHSYGEFNAKSPIGPAIWPHFDLLYFHEGEARLVVDGGESERFEVGQGLLLFPQTSFRGFALTESVLASVQHFSIRSSKHEGLPLPLKRIEGKSGGFIPLRSHAREPVEQDIHRAMKLATEEGSPSKQVIRESLLMIILAQLLEGQSPPDGPASREPKFAGLTKWAQGHLHQDISVAALAAKAQLSESHFRARFAEELGISAGKYLLGLRLNEAKRLLRETRDPIKSIAQRLSYSDVVAFHRSFKKHESITPKAYRDRYAPRG